MPEEGTLSIMRRGPVYQVRYASNNPYNQEHLPRECPNEDTLGALLHHLGIEAEAMPHACAVARQGGVAVLRILVSPEQIQACFRPMVSQAKRSPRPRRVQECPQGSITPEACA